MAEETELEEIAKTSPKGKNEGEGKRKEVGSLESALNEVSSAGKNIFVTALGAATPLMLYPFNKGMLTNAAITAAPLQAGTMIDDVMAKKPVNYTKAAKEGLVGTLITPPLVGLFKVINGGRDYVTANFGVTAGMAATVPLLAAGQAAFVAGYTGVNHVVQNMSFKGLYEKLKKEYWPITKRAWLYVLPFSIWNFWYVYQFGMAAQLAYSSLMTLMFRLVGPKAEGANIKNLASAMNPFPYAAATSNAFYKLGSAVIYSPFKALYEIGSGLYKAVPKPAAPAPTPATAPAH